MSTEWSFGTVPIDGGVSTHGTESSGLSMPAGMESERDGRWAGVGSVGLESSSRAPSRDSKSVRATSAGGGDGSLPATRDQTCFSASHNNASSWLLRAVSHFFPSNSQHLSSDYDDCLEVRRERYCVRY